MVCICAEHRVDIEMFLLLEEGGGRDASGSGAEIPLQPLVKTMGRESLPLKAMEVHNEANVNLQLMEEPILEKKDIQRRL